MFLRGLWDISLNGDLIEISQRHLMPAGTVLLVFALINIKKTISSLSLWFGKSQINLGYEKRKEIEPADFNCDVTP